MDRTQPERQVELDNILDDAQQAEPGVFDVVQVYKDCQRPIQTFEQYLAVTRGRSIVSTSNQSQFT